MNTGRELSSAEEGHSRDVHVGAEVQSVAGASPALSTTLPTTTAVDEGSVAALVDDAGEFVIEPGAPVYFSNGEALPQSSSHPDAFEPESRQHLSAARELMLKSKGYGDRPGRRPSTNRLLMKNFGQRPPIDNTEEFRANHERIFGTERPALNPVQREGYIVRAYKPKVLPEIINNDPHGYDRLDEQKESDE